MPPINCDMKPRRVSRQFSDVLRQLNEFMVLTDNAADNSPLLRTGDGSVTKRSSATDDTVVAHDVLLRLDDNRALIPDKRFFEDLEDLLVQNGGLDTADLPLVLGDEQRRHGVLDTHDEVEKFFQALERKCLRSPAERIHANRVRGTRGARRGDEPLAVGAQDAELVSTQDTLAVVALRPHTLAALTPVGEVHANLLLNHR